MLDFKRMNVLRAVAQHGSFSAAADALSYTQPAVSQQIAALEREAGTRLVQREARGVSLTDAGRVLAGHADAIAGRLAAAEADLRAIAGLEGGRLQLASFTSAGGTIMPPAIAAFRERHPAVELSLVEADPAESIPALRAGKLDLALTLSPSPALDVTDVELVHLLDDVMYVALPVGHRLAERPKPRLEDFAEDQWIAPTAGSPCVALLTDACSARGFQPQIAFETDDYLAAQGLVAAGVGVSLVPDLALSSTRNDIIIREVAPKPAIRQIFAATQPGELRSPAAVAMVDILREVSDAYRPRGPQLAAT